jgi:hypothetical protein
MKISRAKIPVESEKGPVSLSAAEIAKCVSRAGAELHVRYLSLRWSLVLSSSFIIVGAAIWFARLWLLSSMPMRNKVVGVSSLVVYCIYAAYTIVALSREFTIDRASVVMTWFRIFSSRRSLSSLLYLRIESRRLGFDSLILRYVIFTFQFDDGIRWRYRSRAAVAHLLAEKIRLYAAQVIV